MPGFSLTLLLLPSASDVGAPPTSDILALLDEKAEAPGWRWSSQLAPAPISQTTSAPSTEPKSAQSYPRIAAPSVQGFVSAISNACKALIAAEPEITQMDKIAGDGDCGLTLKTGAEGHSTAFTRSKIFSKEPSNFQAY